MRGFFRHQPFLLQTIMNRYFIIALVFTVLQNGLANSTEADTIKVNLNQVDITARKNLMAFTPDKTLHQIKKEEIKLMPVASIDGLLEQLAGTDIRTRGVNGTQADISLRGGTFDQVIVLLNGVNITDPQTGHYNLDIPVDISNIERIEIIQGVQALIMGINPFSGAVNIVTNQNTENNVRIKLSGGSFDTYMQNFSLHKAGKRNEFTFSASNNQSKGYKPNTDYKMQDAYFQAIHRTKTAGRFDVQLAYQQKKYGANGFYSLTYPDQYDNTRTLYGAINWNYAIKNLQLNSQAYYRGHTDKFELFRYPEKIPAWYAGHNYHLNNAAGLKLNINMPLAYGKFTAGCEIRKENIFSSVLGENMDKPIKALFEENAFYTKYDERLISTVFAGIEQKTDKFEFSTGAAIAHSQRFGFQWSGAINMQYIFNDNLRFFVSGNRAYRLPTFTDLYYKSVSQRSNPSLKPEFATTFETGLKLNNNNLKLDVTGFYRAGRNLIDWIKLPDSTVWISSNLSKVNTLGAEFSASYIFDGNFAKKIAVSYSLLNMTKPNTPFISKYVLDYLRNKVNISFQHNICKNLQGTWQAGYYNRAGEYITVQGGTSQSYKPYFIADFRLMWKLRNFELFADLRNFTNTQYADFGGLTQPGINFNTGFTLNFFKK